MASVFCWEGTSRIIGSLLVKHMMLLLTMFITIVLKAQSRSGPIVLGAVLVPGYVNTAVKDPRGLRLQGYELQRRSAGAGRGFRETGRGRSQRRMGEGGVQEMDTIPLLLKRCREFKQAECKYPSLDTHNCLIPWDL